MSADNKLLVAPYETREDIIRRLADTAAALRAEREAHEATKRELANLKAVLRTIGACGRCSGHGYHRFAPGAPDDTRCASCGGSGLLPAARAALKPEVDADDMCRPAVRKSRMKLRRAGGTKP